MPVKLDHIAFLCLIGIMQGWIVYLFFNQDNGALGIAFVMLFLTVDLYFIQEKLGK